MPTFGQRLRDHRSAAGLTLGQIAASTGLRISYLSDIEVGRRPPPEQHRLAELSGCLGLSQSDEAALFEAAARDRGSVKLATAGRDPRLVRLASRLAEHWDALPASAQERIEEIVSGAKPG